MDSAQYEVLTGIKVQPPSTIFLSANDYAPDTNHEPKTLLYGYNCDRRTWHVFQDHNGHIFLYVYDQGNNGKAIRDLLKHEVTEKGIQSLEEIIPNKRLYPQHCDYEFCSYLKEKGVSLPFTNWSEARVREDSIFAGEIF